ncbi:FeoA family protein [Sphingobacterium griseoflavum]|uniref:Ferrous iron transporter FeoA-like domain-containing protein n=1 Tax=Sphingobacterium griseoflavum TaxID=1474952 RepID=A0ABQ3HWW3_9SPHI|nr:FeoA family protein [Sphingobacterium griseoflavum]GHE32623.1 hypothetical protein GCM10017764_14480 [Sphingobacterium griseoflavum]
MQKSFTLDILKVGDVAKISELNATELPAKFFEMGLLPGCTIEVRHKAPFNGPIGLHLLGSNSLVAIRKSEAAHIFVER